MPITLPANVLSDAFSGGPNIITTELAGYGILPPQWGIFDSRGNAVVVADNVMSLEFRQDWQVSDYPQERGAFQSYDKVGSPFEARVVFASGGSLANRRRLLSSIKAIAGDLRLYDVVTPEETFVSCNIVHYDYRRADGRAGVIEVTVHLLEVRVTGQGSLSSTPQANAGSTTPTLTDTKNPDGASTVNGGQVQTTVTDSGHQSEILAQLRGGSGAGLIGPI